MFHRGSFLLEFSFRVILQRVKLAWPGELLIGFNGPVRLYTSVGTEVQYGDLVFTPYLNPFANVLLKQEEANDNIYREIDDYPANQHASLADAEDNQSLPATSSTPAVISSSTTEGSALQLVDDQGEDSRKIPTFVEHSLPIPFTDIQLWDFK
ncbi:hypothetical protein LIER_16403 [Lithospermum erythrorhizon]|uniref:Uncharacterized protein n=1 Tax=Lithospermum erythrorhizon TaxID=34254 RepID=A0AAV3Q6W8_LITER